MLERRPVEGGGFLERKAVCLCIFERFCDGRGIPSDFLRNAAERASVTEPAVTEDGQTQR